jgi:two-component system phosphate regulon sensor histidine kinase PhoR
MPYEDISMPRVSISLGRIVATAMVLTMPAVAALLVLAATKRLGVVDALGAWAAVMVLTCLLVRPHLDGLAALSGWVRAIASGEESGTPSVGDDILSRDASLSEMTAAVALLRRQWQQKSAELSGSTRWNESLLDNLPDPLLLLDSGRRVVRSNRAALRVLGRELKGRDLAAVLRDPNLLEATDAVLRTGGSGSECEFTLPVPVETVFVARIEALEGRAGDGTAAIMTLHDITTVKRIEQMRADFVANASHELRTPLATLLGFIETLRGPARDDSEARERFLAIMQEQASRMSRLVADLLSLSRIELNEHTLPNERVDLQRLLTTATEALKPIAAGKGMTISLAVEEGLAAVVGQPDELAQLFQNLLDNAVKYGRDGTTVEVSAVIAVHLPTSAGMVLRSGPAVAVAVTDRGEGIAREHLPRLTERFYRVDTARSRKLGGTGLGLAIVKHIVNRHRGTLVIESTQGVGSTFTVYLPAGGLPAPVVAGRRMSA